MLIDRASRFKECCITEMIQHKPDIALQTVQMIDENGEIHQTTHHVEINESDMISSIPAYTTKIEYMQQYGTLNDVGEVRLKTAPIGMTEHDVMALRNEIIINNVENTSVTKSIEEPIEKPIEKPIENND